MAYELHIVFNLIEGLTALFDMDPHENNFVSGTLTDEDTAVSKSYEIPVAKKLIIKWGRQNTYRVH